MYHELHFIWNETASEKTQEILTEWLQDRRSLGWEDRGAASGEKRNQTLGATHWAVYFNGKLSASDLMEQSQSFCRELPDTPDKIEYQVVDEHDWTLPFKAYFHAKHVEPCWWVAPPWETEKAEPNNGDQLLIIEPGMAFGTGLHESTRLCLKMLPDLVTPESRVIDIGAGSGILSIAALKLGASAAVAIEIDPQAESNLRHNVALNNVEDRVYIHIRGAEQVEPETAPLVICNMLMSRFKPIAEAVADMVEAGGALLVSGYIENEHEEGIRMLNALGFSVEEDEQLNEWISFQARKRK